MKWEFRFLYWLQTRWRTPRRDRFWYTVTWFGYAASLPLVVSLSLFLRPSSRMTGLASLTAIGCTELFFNHILKRIVCRDRPFVTYPELIAIGIKPKDESFPSGHTSSAFACALILAFSFPPWVGILALSAAGMIAFSRVYLAVHYPTDVIGGVLSAALVDFAVVSLF